MINYDGISEAELVHALYHGSSPLGMGKFQHLDTLTLEDVQKELDEAYPRPAFGIPVMDLPNKMSNREMYFDYYHGHPLKVRLNTEKKEFEERLFDRDAGTGGAAKIVADLKRQKQDQDQDQDQDQEDLTVWAKIRI